MATIARPSIPTAPAAIRDRPSLRARSAGPPSAVKWAIAVEALLVVTDFVGGNPLIGGITILLAIGLYQGSMMARQLVLLGAWLSVIFLPIVVLGMVAEGSAPVALAGFLLFWAVVRGIQIRWLRQDASRVHFGLDCPACGGVDTRAGGVLGGKRVCRSCDARWTSAERDRVDVEVFD